MLLILFLIYIEQVTSILNVKETPTRQVKSLDGVWSFAIDDSHERNRSFEEKWWQSNFKKFKSVIPMPVPSSYNDVPTAKNIRDFVGWAWYQRDFVLQKFWLKNVVFLRFESVNYYCMVWLNNHLVLEHEGGHLPFEVNVTPFLKANNDLTVAVNNTLTPSSIPPGSIIYPSDPENYPPGYFKQQLNFDFFNYAGIDRQVRLYSLPSNYIEDVIVKTDVTKNGIGLVHYNIKTSKSSKIESIRTTLIDKHGEEVASIASTKPQGVLKVINPNLWWPYTMNKSCSGYLYDLKVQLRTNTSFDEVTINVGIRTVKWTNTQFLINDRPFYFSGINKHEDSDLRGKGIDLVLVSRDFHNQQWLGSNAFRTSHYPYAEEYLEFADRMGIVVIGECPAVGLAYPDNFLNLDKHIGMVKDMIARDKNHPSIVAWSMANEPKSSLPIAEDYFKKLFNVSRGFDDTRAYTFVCNQKPKEDKALQFSDLANINAYFGWYSDYGNYEVIPYQLTPYLRSYHEIFNIPVILQEYGADTISGIHMLPSQMFTEEYQVKLMKENFKVFDELKDEFFIGEFIWNYADFMTAQGVTRVVGNKKGVFNRERQPKYSAHILRCRYHRINNLTLSDNFLY